MSTGHGILSSCRRLLDKCDAMKQLCVLENTGRLILLLLSLNKFIVLLLYYIFEIFCNLHSKTSIDDSGGSFTASSSVKISMDSTSGIKGFGRSLFSAYLLESIDY